MDVMPSSSSEQSKEECGPERDSKELSPDPHKRTTLSASTVASHVCPQQPQQRSIFHQKIRF